MFIVKEQHAEYLTADFFCTHDTALTSFRFHKQPLLLFCAIYRTAPIPNGQVASPIEIVTVKRIRDRESLATTC